MDAAVVKKFVPAGRMGAVQAVPDLWQGPVWAPSVDWDDRRKAPNRGEAAEGRDAGRKLPDERDMPYERFLERGPDACSDADLLAIIIRTGTANESAVDLAERILTSGNRDGRPRLRSLCNISLEELMSFNGIGEVKAVKILCIAELSRRLSTERAGEKLIFSSPSSVADYYMETLCNLEQEQVMLLLLDNRLALIREEILSIGTVNASLVSPREVFVRAVKSRAVNVMLLHNHPSGSTEPSQEDLNITQRVQELGRMMDIQLVDHIIIGDHEYLSFKEAGYL